MVSGWDRAGDVWGEVGGLAAEIKHPTCYSLIKICFLVGVCWGDSRAGFLKGHWDNGRAIFIDFLFESEGVTYPL